MKPEEVSTVSGEYKKLVERLNIYLHVPKLRDAARQRLYNIKQRPGQQAADVLVLIEETFEEAEWSEASNKTDQVRDLLLNALRHEEVHRQWRYSNMKGKVQLTIPQIVKLADTYSEEKKTYSAEQVEHLISHVKAVRQEFKKYRPSYNYQQPSTSKKSNQKPCDGCGSTSHEYKSSECPARNNKYRKCDWLGHFPSVCRGTAKKKATQSSPKKGKGKRKSSKWSKKVSEDADNNSPVDPMDDLLDRLLEKPLNL